MYVKTVATIIVCSLSLIAICGATNCTNCIFIDVSSGADSPSCLTHGNTATPCQTLGYVLHLENSVHLNSTDVVLQGDHYIDRTLTVSNVDKLTIRSSGETPSTINCRSPNTSQDEGAGLKFVDVSNLHLDKITVEGCGTLQFSTTLRDGVNAKYRSAVYILNSTNISIDVCCFSGSKGRGMSLHDTGGDINIINSSFTENAVPEQERKDLFGGGGLYIEYTYCTPGTPNCNYTHNMRNTNNNLVIEGCIFKDNTATNNEVTDQIHTVQFRHLEGSDGNNAGQGGGIGITLKGTSSWNSILILNCQFDNNSAVYGGGIEITFQDFAVGNTVTVSGCRFTNNQAPTRGGGALQLGYVVTHNVSLNTIAVHDTEFVNNSAGWGGGVAFFSSRSKKDTRNKLAFNNCTWRGNSGSIGAAVNFQPASQDHIFDGTVPIPLLHRCRFIENKVVPTAKFLSSANDRYSQYILESGVLDIVLFEVDLSGHVEFIGNSGSAIFASSAEINVVPNTTAIFSNNTAINGGAMALLGFSTLVVSPGSQIEFNSNYASELGGAIYATSPHQIEFIYSHKCFISISSPSFIHPDEWNASLTFSHNKAKYGYAIFSDSLLPCVKHVGDITTNISEALQWNSLKYIPELEEYTIATSPSTIDFTLPAELAPGQRVNIDPLSLDDLNQTIPTVYQMFLESDSEELTITNRYTSDGYIQINGKPNTNFNLSLQTIDTRHVSSTRFGRLGNCPFGYILENHKCVCSSGTSDKKLVGITGCNTSSFEVFLQTGYWAGCSNDETFMTGHCPIGYCDYQSVSAGQIAISKSCGTLDAELCTSHRRGLLCGECEEGYTVFYHSENYKCAKCPYGAVGLLIYIFAELIPLMLLFAVITIMKLNMTSGRMQSFLLFAQTIIFINSIPLFTSESRADNILSSLHTFLIGFLSLDFFRLDQLSFCLWSGATVLDNLVFRYLTTLFAILLLALVVLMFRHCSFPTKLSKLVCCQKLRSLLEKHVIHKTSIVHGIATFLVLSYTQYTVTSFQILTLLPLHGEGGKTLRYVVYMQGSVEYFAVEHLPYAIPAVLTILLLSIPPPLLLISYPLMWKIKAKLSSSCAKKSSEIAQSEITIWPIRKLLPLIDSFQGVFRDNHRMFAGLLFLWRMILTAIFAFSANVNEFFVLTEIALLLFLSLHAVSRPYKRQLYNTIDVLMLADMAIINALTWYIYAASSDSRARDSTSTQAATSVKLLLLYLPLLYMVAVPILRLLRKLGLLQKYLPFLKNNENKPSADDSDQTVKAKKMTKGKRKESCVDEDLFARAAELNSLPLTLSSCGDGFMLSLETQ